MTILALVAAMLPIDVSPARAADSSSARRGEAPPRSSSTVAFGDASSAPAAPVPLRIIVKVRDAVDQGLMASADADSGTVRAAVADPTASGFVARHRVRRARAAFPARLRARLLSGASDAQLGAQARQRFARRAARASRGQRLPDLGGTYVLDLGTGTRARLAQALAALRSDPAVVYAQEDRAFRHTYVPNDPSYSTSGSWGQSYADLYGLKKIGTTAAWDTARGDGVIVAVVDSGLDLSHPDLAANIWTNAGEIPGNATDDDGNGFIDDVRGWDFVGASWMTPTPDADPSDVLGHGTHVAGTIAAVGDNNLGVVGVAWKSRVMAVRGLDNNGQGPESALAAAIVYAADNGADVINASFGGEGSSTTLQNAVDYAHGLGVVFVAAAGNSHLDAADFSPANVANAITVSAVDPFDSLASFSNFGTKIDVAAPGVDILSLEKGTGGFIRLQGTSMAAPHVSGVAALILQGHPSFTVEQVRQVLRSSATDLGLPGRDTLYGYGRVSASQAVLVNDVLEAQITAPANNAVFASPVTVTGTARGTTFSQYVLEVGAGDNPTTWTTLATSSLPVTNGTLGTFNPGTVADGAYTIRLRAITTGGGTFSDQVRILVRYLSISQPAVPNVALTPWIKPGQPVTVAGAAVGPTFQRFRLEWAPGRDATTGWSTAGVTLVGGGTSPINGGTLGTWTTPTTGAREHTLRLAVDNAGFTSYSKVTVYLERELSSAAWPILQPNTAQFFDSPVPMRGADGKMRLVMCGTLLDRTECRSMYDFQTGAARVATVAMSTTRSEAAPAAGDLDPAAGEEFVIANGQSLHIYSADAQLLRSINVSFAGNFGATEPGEITTLSDLDGDGSPEILALSRNFPNTASLLHVFRANGQSFNSNIYPITINGPGNSSFTGLVGRVPVDLNGDGRKEIVVVAQDQNRTQYIVRAYNADGSAYTPWSTPVFSATQLELPAAADLDRDGRQEIVLLEGDSSPAFAARLRVLDNTGATKPGWPVSVQTSFGIDRNGGFSIGDLDLDQKDEIAVGVRGGVAVFRQNGTSFAFYSFFSWGMPRQVQIADIDGDSNPDILVSHEQLGSLPGPTYHDLHFLAFNRTGTLIRDWPIFGVAGRQPSRGGSAIGDFDGDGKTDVAIRFAVIDGGEASGTVSDGGFVMMTTGATFDPARADWTLNHGDPQQSRTRRPPPPSTETRLAPVADAYVRDGSYAGTNFGTATTLVVKNTTAAGNNRISYLRFPLTGVNGTVSSAKLRLYGSRTTATTATDAAFAVSSNTWTETGINFTNRPPLGAKQGASVTITPTAQYYEWDVTAFVRAQKTAGATAVSLAVSMDQQVNDSPDTFSSREASANKPELVVSAAPDTPPTVAVPASASPSNVTGTTTQLAVLGADNGGEGALTYTWSLASGPLAVDFSANGTNAAKNTTATFHRVGGYDFLVTIRDAGGQTATSTVSVSVQETLTRVEVRPVGVVVPLGSSFRWDAFGFDQFGEHVNYGDDSSLTNVAWSVSGGGEMRGDGLFAADVAGGPFTVTARELDTNIAGSTTFSVAGTATLTLAPAADAYVRDGTSAGSNFGTATTLVVKNPTAAGNNRITYLRFPLAGVGANIVSAKLRLYGNRPVAHSATDSAYAVASTSWSETGINWNNRPALGESQGAGPAVGLTAQYWELDALNWVRAQRAAGAASVSLAVVMDQPTNESPDTFSSREAASNRPQLVVEFTQDSTTTTTLAPAADAYVRDGSNAAANFGTAVNLDVKTTTAAGNNRTTYVRFPLTGVGSDVTAATLRVYGRRPVAHAAVTNARAVSSNTWTETGITWNNKPVVGTVQAGVTVGTTAQYWEWDVTAFVRAQRTAGLTSVSLALEMATAVNDGPDAFNSREAASNRPQLVVTSRP